MRAGSQQLMARSPAGDAESRFPATDDAGEGAARRLVCAPAVHMAKVPAAARGKARHGPTAATPAMGNFKVVERTLFVSSRMYEGRARPATCIGNKECGGSARSRIDFCRSVCLSCHMPDSACLDACMKCLDASCVSIRGSPGEFRISSRSSRRCAGDAPPARERARTGSRAYLYVPYAGRSRQ